MVISSKYNGTFVSKINPPDFKGLMEQSIEVSNEAKKEGKTMFLTCEISYIMAALENGKRFSVLKTKSTYEIQTDGKITTYELYTFIKQAIEYMIIGLNQQEQNMGIHPTQLKPTPMKEMLNDLIPIAHGFSK
jgi:hypothetical protein